MNKIRFILLCIFRDPRSNLSIDRLLSFLKSSIEIRIRLGQNPEYRYKSSQIYL